jgi:hypothetical protein
MLVFLVVRAWRVLRFSTSEFFVAMMWMMVPSFTRRKRNFVWRMQIKFLPCDIFLIGPTKFVFSALLGPIAWSICSSLSVSLLNTYMLISLQEIILTMNFVAISI